MSNTHTQTNSSAAEAPILVELTSPGGMRQVSLKPTDLAEMSAKAVNSSMHMIKAMAEHTIDTIDMLANKPSEVEIEFSIKMDAELGALLSKVGGEGNLNVKLIWKRDKSGNE